MRARKATAKDAYVLEISLREIEPRIWRRVTVGADTTLHKLHWVIQMTMGWTNSHLHQFIIGNACYSQPEHDPDFEMGWDDEHSVRLRDLLWTPGAVFAYEYDFGDNWQHNVVIEAIYPRQKDETYPLCRSGARACPPEDCGGPPGYERVVASLRDPRDPEHESYLTWLGGPWDPNVFDIAAANERLRPLARRRTLDRYWPRALGR
jgi:hypothetical protein